MKAFTHRLLQRFGYDIHRFRASASLEAQLAAMLRSGGFDLVLDVGANAGQYGRRLRDHGYSGRIVSFEPLREAWTPLKAASSGDKLWEVADPIALGERDGEIDIHVSENSYSSSALGVLDAHLRAAPDSRYVGRELVPMRRLDAVAGRYLRPASVALLKVDTQGFEDRVLAGAAGILPRIAGLQLELSLVPLYEGQKLIAEMLEQVRGLGFELWGAWPVLVEPDTGRLLQVDAVFFRPATKSS
ncbi:MAG: FkbM family methyltransferase [Burkholderiales bacterium]